MSNNTPTHSTTYLEEKKKKKTEREETREKVEPVVHAERERDWKGQGTVSTSIKLADWPDLAPMRDRGQRQ